MEEVCLIEEFGKSISHLKDGQVRGSCFVLLDSLSITPDQSR